MSNLKILHTVEFYYPSKGGMQELVKQLSERMVKAGHDVTVATAKLSDRKTNNINGVKIVEFDVSGNFAKGIYGEVEAYKKFIINSNFDLIAIFGSQQWATDILLPFLDKIKAKKVFIPTGFPALHSPKYQLYFENMRKWMKNFDMNVFHSNNYQDVNFARQNNIDKYKIIPNGADENEFLAKPSFDIRKKLAIPEDHFLILHVGSHTGIKGHKEAIKMFWRAKIKKTTFLIVGNPFSKKCTKSCKRSAALFKYSINRFHFDKKLIVANLSREETIAAYIQADLFLFPSNIECSPIVLFECMASKTPFLVTDVGNSKEIIDWSHAGILLPTVIRKKGYKQADVKKATRELEKIYENSSLREKMKEKGFNAWQKKFTWAKIANDYEALYKSLIK